MVSMWSVMPKENFEIVIFSSSDTCWLHCFKHLLHCGTSYSRINHHKEGSVRSLCIIKSVGGTNASLVNIPQDFFEIAVRSPGTYIIPQLDTNFTLPVQASKTLRLILNCSFSTFLPRFAYIIYQNLKILLLCIDIFGSKTKARSNASSAFAISLVL